ncbi:MAG: hypothetical protein JHD15_08520 [Phenylobacterium sp.]|uniref:ComEC/Rec2 family competence protein n=1 Tax=Phenylobacterium sp. TaxID=1871053 RepID=UPI001A349BD8|nr:hypothetical protein [Phenylobacterium sp.]MBJ7410393.1 hypothetical protein [Phenylobacterium sp.]
MFELQTFPARDGDALILTWGDAAAPRRMLIDCGRESCWTSVKAFIQGLPADQREFELLVVTHIDADHIAGVLKMLNDPERRDVVSFKEVWFNGYDHLRMAVETFGAAQGDKLSKILIEKPGLWNKRFDHGPVVAPDPGQPPRFTIEGLQLTLLSPTRDKLAALEAVWADWLKSQGLEPEQVILAEPPPNDDEGFETFGAAPDVEALFQRPLPQDKEPPNGSSIAFSVEYEGVRVLLTGDAHPDVLTNALSALPAADRAFDLVKLSHHGSHGNISRPLLATWVAHRFLISTDGSRHKHPHAATLAHILKAKEGAKAFFFNHRHEQAADWDRETLRAAYNYTTRYPVEPGRLVLDLTALDA